MLGTTTIHYGCIDVQSYLYPNLSYCFRLTRLTIEIYFRTLFKWYRCTQKLVCHTGPNSLFFRFILLLLLSTDALSWITTFEFEPNCVMEWKAHYAPDSSSTNRMSRLQDDLSSSPHNGSILRNSPNTTMLRRTPPGGQVPHICVVGAGMAGLRCAEILTRQGLKVTILEARDRIGGRVCTSHAMQMLGWMSKVHQSNYLGHLADLWAFLSLGKHGRNS